MSRLIEIKNITDVIHIIAGLVTALITMVNSVLATFMFVGFIIYELDEDWHLSDEAFQDIKEYLIGLYMGAIIVLVMSTV